MNYEDWTRLHCTLYACYDGTPGTSAFTRKVSYTSAWLIRRGQAEITCNGKRVTAEAGDWLICGPGLRTQQLSDDVGMLSVIFYANWPSGDSLFPRGLPVVFQQTDCPKLENTGLKINRAIGRHLPGHNYQSLLKGKMSIEAYLYIQKHLPGFLNDLIVVLRAHDVTVSGERILDPRIMQVLAFLNNLPLDAPFLAPEVASRIGMSPAHLDRLFLAQVGRSMKQHIDQKKLHYAEETLTIPGVRVKEVAATLGFVSLANFTRWFRRFHNLSPREFQNSQRI